MSQQAPKTRTITLTGRPPVKVREDEWPRIAEGRYEWRDGEYRPQATREVDLWIRVRRHADGRAIVYGGYSYESAWQHEENRRVRVGIMTQPDDDLASAIERVGGELADRITDAPKAGRLRDVIDECVADLPAEEL